MTDNYSGTPGAKYRIYEGESDEPTINDVGDVEEMYYDEDESRIVVRIITDESYLSVTIPVQRDREGWTEFVRSLVR